MYFCANNPALNTDNISCPFKDLIIKTPPIKVIEQSTPVNGTRNRLPSSCSAQAPVREF